MSHVAHLTGRELKLNGVLHLEPKGETVTHRSTDAITQLTCMVNTLSQRTHCQRINEMITRLHTLKPLHEALAICSLLPEQTKIGKNATFSLTAYRIAPSSPGQLLPTSLMRTPVKAGANDASYADNKLPDT